MQTLNFLNKIVNYVYYEFALIRVYTSIVTIYALPKAATHTCFRLNKIQI